MSVQSKAPAAGGGQPPDGRVGRRAAISAKTLRTDRWWIQPVVTFAVLFSFIVYSTWAAFIDRDYFSEPYISPFYSPCLDQRSTNIQPVSFKVHRQSTSDSSSSNAEPSDCFTPCHASREKRIFQKDKRPTLSRKPVRGSISEVRIDS